VSVETAFRQILTADAAIAAIVGPRVSPLRSEQSSIYPQVQYHKVAGGKAYCMRGVQSDASGQWQFDCWAETYAAAKDLAEAVTEALTPNARPYAGTVDGVAFQGVFINEDFDAMEPPAYGDDVGLYWVPVGVTAWHTI
jgi:hypothetical protein